MDKIKPVLVFQISVGNMTPSDVQHYMREVADSIINDDIKKDYHCILMPTLSKEHKVELLSPNLKTSEDIEQHLKAVEKLEESILKNLDNLK